MSNKRIIALVLAVVIVIGGIVMSSISAIVSNAFTESDTYMYGEVPEKEGDPTQRIAHFSLEGEIVEGGGGFMGDGYNHTEFLEQLDNVKNDGTVKGVLLTVDTPGGSTYASDEIYQKIKEIKHKGKKIYVQMKTMAASGGYYISAPADKIYAGPQTTTGSIGVIMSNTDYTGLQEKLGIKENVFKSGEHKDILSSSRKMTQEERNIMQSIIDDSFDRFVNIVKDGRNMNEKKVRELADGRIYTAQQAKSNGLIDEIGYEDDVIKGLSKEIKVEEPEVFEYDASGSFFTLFNVKSTVQGLKSDVRAIKSVITNDTQAKPMYLYEG
ncbi:signal peptide peptidase SppA [Staphylococcus auricularis]|uniref:Signal peptide peptidase SppA n=1 Tax=Staphylococcus auricularis TaxID=29379 RepID=A0ABX5IHB1_9STAP|nr:signal peptide peptidase SppA [Staphylococcus auricularis]MCE5038308.1 signal peptide peptidase SppA [Staphylococcus auricularis]MEB6569174.1 signal peptide peptidase SppA [Staphylococcus auricularis]PTH18946.1 signal peptide peptidase SppA [Staphylococcus auricularis]PTH27975.1 signal peptide peptidase SppA [Staphylococcus auricularis]